MRLGDALIVPDCRENRFSLSAWDKSGHDFSGNKGTIRTLRNLISWSKHGIYIKPAYRSTRRFRSEREKSVADDHCDDS